MRTLVSKLAGVVFLVVLPISIIGCGPAPAPYMEQYGDAAEEAKNEGKAPNMTPNEGI